MTERPADSVISRTCFYTAAGRAVGAREPDPSARNPDYLAEKLLGDDPRLVLDHPSTRALSLGYEEAMKDPEIVGTVRAMTVRTRFIDEALERAIAAGATHLIILGAGLDSHAYRCRDLLANARVFEVDRPATQALKKQRVEEALGGAPPNLSYVPIDFQRDDLAEVLRRHGHDQAQRTFFIMEGVTMYVPEDGARATLRYVAGHPPGSGIVFDFVYRPMVDALMKIDWTKVPEAAKAFIQRFLDMIKDEPWVFGLPVGGEREFLGEVGLELREALTIGGEESLKRYLTRSDGTQVGAETMAQSMARMAERARAAGPASPEAQAMSPERMREQQRVMAYQLAVAVVP
ncbi:MAG TPA: SAM-dependent methyltransferase [Vicinamibacterales bacterium]|nr:SAM-dependent methyltransferase [Vicinamibacterales bacterium]